MSCPQFAAAAESLINSGFTSTAVPTILPRQRRCARIHLLHNMRDGVSDPLARREIMASRMTFLVDELAAGSHGKPGALSR